ncbi:MAG: hypothetical protein P4M01_12700 [Acidobacteriota bacterium]|nr:hypothetical protein [Acidobacteriota bacterium]
MAFCPSCGSPVDGQFCARCGASTAGPGPSQGMSASQGVSLNAASALCYLFGLITGIFFLAVAPYNQHRRVRFHAFQSILLNVVLIVAHVAVSIVSLTFHLVSFSLGLMMGSLHLLVSLAFFLAWLYMMWSSYQGSDVRLPLIGSIADGQAGTDNPTTGSMGRAA